MQSIIVTQVHDKIHENLYISTCSFTETMKVVENQFFKLTVKNALKRHVVGTQWIASMRQF